MQLVYQWNVGNEILTSSLEQINDFLNDPTTLVDEDDEEEVSLMMPIKKQKSEKKGKKKDKEKKDKQVSVKLSIHQSISIIEAIINDSMER
jgi:hypothetical protein